MASGGRTKGSPVSALLLRRYNLAKAHDRWRVPWMNKLSLWEVQNKSPPPRPQLDGSTARPGLSTHCPLMSGRAQRLAREHVPGGPSQPGRQMCVQTHHFYPCHWPFRALTATAREQTAGAFPASSQPVGPEHWPQGSGEAREERWGRGEAGFDWIYAISPDSML